MRKLGISSVEQLQAQDFEKYLQLFNDGLSEDQANLIKQLFMDRFPSKEDEAVALDGA
jgi:hypothetical protein